MKFDNVVQSNLSHIVLFIGSQDVVCGGKTAFSSAVVSLCGLQIHFKLTQDIGSHLLFRRCSPYLLQEVIKLFLLYSLCNDKS